MAAAALRALPDVDQAPSTYDLQDLRSPVLSGLPLRVFASALEWEPLGNLVYPIIFQRSGVTQVLHGPQAHDRPAFLPDLPVPPAPHTEAGCAPLSKYNTAEQAVVSTLSDGFLQPLGTRQPSPPWRASARDYLEAYKSGTVTPTIALQRLVSFLKSSESRRPWPCHWLTAWSEEDIMRQAAESTRRYQEGCPRPLEGVPFAVKDVCDALPYPTTAGTAFLASRRPVRASAPAVTALQAMGAVLLGKSATHEIGLGVTGLNLRTGTALNPWGLNPKGPSAPARAHHTGGSSAGSGALVGAGVCPIAIGSDGGGSIRIPSSFCGCVGLKPTSGRVTGRGGVEIDCTVATYGPMGGSVEDVALLYSVMANQGRACSLQGEPLPAPQLPHPLPQALPPPAVGEKQAGAGAGLPLSGLKLGIFWSWFEDCDAEVRACCRAAVDAAVGQGAEVVEVVVPELEALRVAHSVTIVSEMRNCMQAYLDDPSTRALFNTDVRIGLMGARKWTGADYVTAQRIRARGIHHFRKALGQAHVLVTPSVPCTAPAISAAAYNGGISDLGLTSRIMRFVSQANMTGLPAISVPVGCDTRGLPIGLQFIGRPWEEATLLRAASVMESVGRGQGPQQKPALWVNPLTGESAGL